MSRGRPPKFIAGESVEVVSFTDDVFVPAQIVSCLKNGIYLVSYPSSSSAASPVSVKRIRRLAAPPPSHPDSPFQPGDEVEVLTRAKGLCGGWYEASIETCGGKNYRVVHKCLKDGNGELREKVPVSEVRPRPMNKGGSFMLGEKIEVIYKNGWWDGTVCRVLNEGDGVVGYEVDVMRPKKVITCTGEMMRKRLRWVDGKWVLRKEARLTSPTTDATLTPASSMQSSHTSRGMGACHDEALSEMCNKSKKTDGSTFLTQLLSLPVSGKVKEEGPKEDIRRSADSLGGFIKICGQGEKECVTGKKRKNYIPRKCITAKRRNMNTKASSRGDSVVLSKPSSIDGQSTLTTSLANEGGTPMKRLGGHESPNSECQHKEAEREHEFFLSNPRVDIACDLSAPLSNESTSQLIVLPFEKRSPMWKYIDQEVKPKMRQQPHFQPLEQFPEMQREGIAIGLMVTYENLMSYKGTLKMDSSCHDLDEILKGIIHLEGHGFEVQHLRARLEELARVKSDREQLLQQKSATEGKVLEKKENSVHLNAELEETDNVIMVLNQVLNVFHRRRTSLSVQKKESETTITKLQTDLCLAEEKLASCESTLQNLLTALQ